MNIKDYFKKTKETAQKKPVEEKKEKVPYYEAVKSFEKDRLAIVATRAKLFLFLAIAEMVVILALAIALAGLSPLKTAVPYVIRVDNSTGFTDIAKPLSLERENFDQVTTKYFMAKFIINYESYDWETIQSMYDIVNLMSNGGVFNGYKNAMLADNSPLNVLKNDFKIKVKVKSITFLNKDTAQVRFVKLVLKNNGILATEYKQTSWIATVAFDYKKSITTEGERLINPLGFEAVSYRVDPELVK